MLKKRACERVLSEIARAEAELDLFEQATNTLNLIDEDVFRNKVFKIIGYIQLGRDHYDEAEKTFQKLSDEHWRQICLKETAFRKKWGNLDEKEDPDGEQNKLP